MNADKMNHSNADLNKGEEETHKGTIFSVGVVGAVILINYLILYGLYMARV